MTEEDSEPAHSAPHSIPQWTPPAANRLQAMLPQYDAWEVIGHGGMGAVYKARQISLDRPVAIKVLPPQDAGEAEEFTQRFKNEARTMARMNHPAIVSVHDFGETSDGRLYFAMEYIDGTDVHKMIQAQGRLPPEHALAITAHVCDALAYAHEHGVIHRDIKPANILINMEGAVKVADFGLASMHDPSAEGQKEEGPTMGTPDFVAPEVLTLGMTVDGRADLYAVGVMLYNMLTGEIPRASSPPASQQTGCDARFDSIVSKAVEHDVAQRYQSAREIRRDLDRILTVPVAKENPPAQARGGMRPRPRHAYAPQPSKPAPWGLIVAAVVVLGGSAALLIQSGSPPAASSETEATQAEVPDIVLPEPEVAMPKTASSMPAAPAPVVVETDPNAPKGSPLSTLPVLSHAGHHYQIVEAQTSFNEAQKHAEALGAHLVTISSQDEMHWLDQALSPLLKEVPQWMATIGGMREGGTWKWVTGEPFVYTRWEEGALPPDTEPERRFALKLTAKGPAHAAWGNGFFDGRRASIIEWDSTPPNTPVPSKQPMPGAERVPVTVAESPGVKRLRELEAQFRTALERDVLAPHQSSLASLNSKYMAALDRALSAATASSNLPLALALRDEKRVIESGSTLPDEDAADLPPALKTFRGTYRTSRKPLEQARHNGIITVFLRYEEVLNGLAAEWTKAAKLDDAKRASLRVDELGRERLAMLNEVKEIELTDGKIIVLTGRDRFVTPESFQPPVEITVVAKTDSRDLRLAYTAKQLIFNWEIDPSELRLDNDPGGARHAKGQGRIPEDTFVTIRWRVMPNMQSISVDGKRRYLHFGDYSKVDSPVSVFPTNSTVTLKSLKVKALDLKTLEDRASSVPELKDLFVGGQNWTGKITLPAGKYLPLRRINIGASGRRDPNAQSDEERGEVVSQPGTDIENVRFHLQEGSWKAAGGLFRDVKITADLGGSFEARDCLFQDCAFAKEGAWYVAWFSSKWSFTNCVFTGSFLQNWKLGDVGMKLNACTFHDVDFSPIGYKDDAGAETGKDWLSIQNCRLVNCRVPESFALATKNCVFEKCTFGPPEAALPLTSPLNAVLYLQDTVNAPQAGPGRTLEALPGTMAPAGVGAALKHRRTENVLEFE